MAFLPGRAWLSPTLPADVAAPLSDGVSPAVAVESAGSPRQWRPAAPPAAVAAAAQTAAGRTAAVAPH